MAFIKFSSFLIFCNALFGRTLAWRSFESTLTGVECVQLSNVTSFLNCTIVHVKNKGALQMTVQFKDEVTKPHLDLAVITERENQPDFVVINVTNINGCEFLENKGFTLLKIIRKEFSKYSNLPNHCPVPKGTVINVKNLMLDANSFPPYMPETKFNVHVKLWELQTPAFDLIVQGAFIAKRRRPLT